MKKLLLLSMLGVAPTVAFGVIGTEGKGGGSDVWAGTINVWAGTINKDVLTAIADIKDVEPKGKSSLAVDLADLYVKKFGTNGKITPEQEKAVTNIVTSLINKVQEKGGLLDVLKQKFGTTLDLSEKVGKLGKEKEIGEIFGLIFIPGKKNIIDVRQIDLDKNENRLKLIVPALDVVHAELEVLPVWLSATEISNIILPSALAVLSQNLLEVTGNKQTGTPAPGSNGR